MAEYDEEGAVLRAIFGDRLEEAWKDDADFLKYVGDLTSYGVDRLSRESDHLLEEKHHLDKQTEDLAFNNYKTFIQTANCSSDIFKDFQVIESSLSSLQDKLPEFISVCQGFMDTAQSITQSRKSNTLTLQKHTQLLEILEVPQLMDTCVRNGYYDEALELAAYVRRLEKKYSSISVIKTICDEVKKCTQLLLAQLLQQLRSDIQLPACLRIIGYLRHMDIFTEAELRLKFLQARDAWFQNIISGIPRADAYDHISKVIEVSRVHLFDIITQYRAIFTDDDSIIKPSSNGVPREALFLQSWVQSQVDQFLNMLKEDLDQGMGSRLDSVLGKCMYFGLSFSRVGCDFRGLLANIFQQAAINAFEESLKLANERYDKSMETYTLVLKSSYQPLSTQTMTEDSMHPPSNLLQFTPLALLCNDVLTALNNLRVCAPINICTRITRALELSLSKVADTISNFHRLEHDSFTLEESNSFSKMCDTFASDFIPYCNKCIQLVFPQEKIAKALGMTAQQLNHKAPSLYSLDYGSITEPIKDFIPNEASSAKASTADELVINNQAKFHIDSDDGGPELMKKDNADEPADSADSEVKSIAAADEDKGNVSDIHVVEPSTQQTDEMS